MYYRMQQAVKTNLKQDKYVYGDEIHDIVSPSQWECTESKKYNMRNHFKMWAILLKKVFTEK